MTHEERCKAWAWLQEKLSEEPPWPLDYIRELQDNYDGGFELATLRAENARLTAEHEAAADELARVVQELREAREALTKLMQWATLDKDDGYDMTIVLSIDDYRYFLAIANGERVPE